MEKFLHINDMSVSERNTRLILMMQCCQSAIFFLPVLILYYQDEIGLTFKDFMIIEAIFCATVIAMEVPSGWLSDLWSRKHTLAAGLFFTASGFSWLFLADSFADATFGEILTGIGVSLISGTNSAMLYDSLLQDGRQEYYRRLEGLRHGCSLYSLAFASLTGGFLYQINHSLPVMLTALAQTMGMFCALIMVEPIREYKEAERHPIADMFDTMKYALHGHKEIAGVIFFAMVIFTSTKIMLWVQQPYYQLLELPEAWYGLFTAAGFFLGGLGGHLGHMLDGHVRNRTMFLFMLILVVCACLIAGTIKNIAVTPMLLIGSVMWGFGWPRVQSAINMRVSSERRATILSTASLMINLAFIPIGPVMGLITDIWGIQQALLVLGLFILAGGGLSLTLFVMNARRKEA
ncbi:MAG: MFS transporter [Micavibrio aeruginosavorus]|uniref:MFS transporter n=1 Tax=Micavibrio aeruginosavorus TaxID=349221 RepID=A0A7T5UI51_9BACT|nr:MAG: MFS transporter [Micavibrio aeruginosavorus]